MDINRYIEEHIDEEPEWLYGLWRDTNISLLNGRMCSGHLQGRLLKMLVRMIRPDRILELGTFSGYSALCLAEGLEGDAVIDTVETDDELQDFILSHVASSPYTSRINLIIADALEYLSRPGLPLYDMAFIDADKRSYCEYYEATLPLIRDGGFIIADNTLWDGHVADPDHQKDAQTRGIVRFNDMVARDKRVEKVILPLRDGLTLIRKKP